MPTLTKKKPQDEGHKSRSSMNSKLTLPGYSASGKEPACQGNASNPSSLLTARQAGESER